MPKARPQGRTSRSRGAPPGFAGKPTAGRRSARRVAPWASRRRPTRSMRESSPVHPGLARKAGQRPGLPAGSPTRGFGNVAPSTRARPIPRPEGRTSRSRGAPPGSAGKPTDPTANPRGGSHHGPVVADQRDPCANHRLCTQGSPTRGFGNVAPSTRARPIPRPQGRTSRSRGAPPGFAGKPTDPTANPRGGSHHGPVVADPTRSTRESSPVHPRLARKAGQRPGLPAGSPTRGSGNVAP
jgi:hypothetical protein